MRVEIAKPRHRGATGYRIYPRRIPTIVVGDHLQVSHAIESFEAHLAAARCSLIKAKHERTLRRLRGAQRYLQEKSRFRATWAPDSQAWVSSEKSSDE